MAAGNKNDALTLINPNLPRIVGGVTRSIQFSSPVPGRLKVFWEEGINPDIVREHWPSHAELPYLERKVPPHVSSTIPVARRKRKRYGFGVTKKMVIYERAHSEIRLVLLLGAAYDREGEAWQPILRSSVERDPGVDPRQSRLLEKRLWDEICLVQRRGRPRGTGHAKASAPQRFACSPDTITRLRKQGLDDRDLRILFGRWDLKSYKKIGGELGISGQAAWKRWSRRIERIIRRVNPNFSRASFQLSSLGSK